MKKALGTKKQHGENYIILGFLGICVFYIVPFIRSLAYTFTQGVSVKRFVGLKNFTDLFHNPVFVQAVKNTGIFIGVLVPLLLFLSLTISYMMLGKRNSLVRIVLLTPLVIPSSTLVLSVEQLLGNQGMVNRIFTSLGLGTVDFMNNHAFFVIGVIYLLKNTGYMIVILNGAMTAVPGEYKDIYKIDSNSNMGFMLRIMLPQILPLLIFVVILAVMNGLKIYREIYTIYGETPPLDIYMLQHFMNNNFMNLNYQRLCTAAFIVIAILSIFIVGLLKLQDRVRVE